MTGLLILAIATACGAAVRSTWSPCGLSMLSTITPLTERARGHRYGPPWPGSPWARSPAVPRSGCRLRCWRCSCRRRAVGHCGARNRGGVRRRGPGRRPARCRCTPADPSAPGQRNVARPVPPLDLRGRVRGADRFRARDLCHDGRGLPDDRARRVDRFADRRAEHRDAVRRGTRAGRAGRRRATTPEATRALHARLHATEPASRHLAAALQGAVAVGAAGWAFGSALPPWSPASRGSATSPSRSPRPGGPPAAARDRRRRQALPVD